MAHRVASSAPLAPGRGLGLVAIWVVAAGLAVVSPASAHDMWIEPDRFALAPGERLALRLRVGHGDDVDIVPRRNHRIRRFDARDGDGLVTPVLGIDGKDPAGYLRPRVQGGLLVGYESDGAYSVLEAERFTAYLLEEGLESIATARQQRRAAQEPGRERFARALKTILRVGTDGAVRDRPLGLALEIVVEDDLARWQSGTPLRLRVLYRGAPLAGALVDLQPLAGAAVATQVRTDAAGRASLPLDEGSWRAAVVHMVPAAPGTTVAGQAVDWDTVFATSTFAVGTSRAPTL